MQYKKVASISVEEMLRDYFQQQEDKYISIVMIGANNGQTEDFLIKYLLKPNVKGLLVEPVSSYFNQLAEKFRANNRLHFVKCAVYHRVCYRSFYRLADDETLPNWTRGLGSFYKRNVLYHENQVENISNLVLTEKVKCVPLSTLLRKYEISEIGILQIDVEGYDYEIIRNFDFSFIRPQIIIVEYLHLTTYQYYSIINILEESGYQVVRNYDSFDLMGVDTRVFL